jgi:hypothetical protein
MPRCRDITGGWTGLNGVSDFESLISSVLDTTVGPLRRCGGRGWVGGGWVGGGWGGMRVGGGGGG